MYCPELNCALPAEKKKAAVSGYQSDPQKKQLNSKSLMWRWMSVTEHIIFVRRSAATIFTLDD